MFILSSPEKMLLIVFSLSPGSQYKKSEAKLNGKAVKRGFNRDDFFKDTERILDKMFGLDRNYLASYQGRKDFIYSRKRFIKNLLEQPTSKKQAAFRVLDIKTPQALKTIYLLKSIPLTPQQLTKKGIDLVVKAPRSITRAGSIDF